jgi:FkbM family methyltransferase
VPNTNDFFSAVSGIIHVGGNIGQECELYDSHGLKVLWIEPIPEIFEVLKKNIERYPLQIAIKDLLMDRENQICTLHVTNNMGMSSSVLPLKEHRDIWPEVKNVASIELVSTTLDHILSRPEVDVANYQGLIMDTQGTELLVLKGAKSVLGHVQYVKTEVADFEAYEGCCQLEELSQYLLSYGFHEVSRNAFAERSEGGKYYDITFKKLGA